MTKTFRSAFPRVHTFPSAAGKRGHSQDIQYCRFPACNARKIQHFHLCNILGSALRESRNAQSRNRRNHGIRDHFQLAAGSIRQRVRDGLGFAVPTRAVFGTMHAPRSSASGSPSTWPRSASSCLRQFSAPRVLSAPANRDDASRSFLSLDGGEEPGAGRVQGIRWAPGPVPRCDRRVCELGLGRCRSDSVGFRCFPFRNRQGTRLYPCCDGRFCMPKTEQGQSRGTSIRSIRCPAGVGTACRRRQQAVFPRPALHSRYPHHDLHDPARRLPSSALETASARRPNLAPLGAELTSIPPIETGDSCMTS